jgi:hypothetical protein
LKKFSTLAWPPTLLPPSRHSQRDQPFPAKSRHTENPFSILEHLKSLSGRFFVSIRRAGPWGFGSKQRRPCRSSTNGYKLKSCHRIVGKICRMYKMAVLGWWRADIYISTQYSIQGAGPGSLLPLSIFLSLSPCCCTVITAFYLAPPPLSLAFSIPMVCL